MKMKLWWLLSLMLCWPSAGIICRTPSTYEIIYMNGEPVYPPILLTEFIQGSEAKVRSDADKDYFLLDMSGYTLMCFEIPFQPQGSPDYNSGAMNGEEVAASISILTEKYTTGFVALRRKRQFFTNNSQFNLGFWNLLYLNLGKDFLSTLTPTAISPSFEKGYGKGYSEALGKGKLIYESQSNQIWHQRKDDWYKNGYNDGFVVGLFIGYSVAKMEFELMGTWDSDSVYVDDYYRKDGTHVQSHYRSRPSR